MFLNSQVKKFLKHSLDEDLGSGDITCELLIPASSRAKAEIYSKARGVLAGVELPGMLFRLLDEHCIYLPQKEDGALLSPGQLIASVEGSARAILSGERTSLNFLQHLSGIATITRTITDMLGNTSLSILDTRKTIPGMRSLEKYAVRAGGGKNHRMGLYDGIMIKNNHLKFSSLAGAVTRAKRGAPPLMKVEVEVETLEQVREALEAGAEMIMLDNMDTALMKEACALIAGRALIEISGNITEERLPQLRELAIDFISMGRLTHSVKALDISLRITEVTP
ncbi:MAG: carboxylating nicotinate-nucleotide diphosphorylase [Candidatus Eremiobacteraeota bacterium]|nr:carboxylating nicotinate-nucleotide diphosphorylase [Candidatus Eremiobacteraeota bacterium]